MRYSGIFFFAELFVALHFCNSSTEQKYSGLERNQHLNALVGSIANCLIMVLLLPKHKIDEICAQPLCSAPLTRFVGSPICITFLHPTFSFMP